jgi:hypothetical protein
MGFHHVLCVLLTLSGIVVAGADLPYVGKWKMNPAKSDFGETTVTYQQLPSGEMQATIDGQSYTFKLDEKDYQDPFGNTVAWKALGPNSWQTTYKLNGKLLWTNALSLSQDGKSLTIHTTGTKPNGEAINDTVVFDRMSGGGPGLAGHWKTKNVKVSSPSQLEITPSGADGLTYKIVDVGLTCDSKLDGKDYPCSGPTLPKGWTVAFAKGSGEGLDMTVKKDGKQLYKVTYTVSADGKTLTETGVATATNEKTKVVYERQ